MKKLHLEIHHPELGEISDTTESLFAVGHQVGAIAQEIYGTQDAVEIEFKGNLSIAIRETEDLIANGADFPIFEATFQYDGVLVRVDALLPDGDGWHAIEVKASTSVKEHHKIDCAIQYWVMRNVGLNIKSISLGHIDNQFVYQGDGNYAELIVAADITEDVLLLAGTVPALVADARVAAGSEVPDITVGAQCNNPYDCQFYSHCWPVDAEYPVMGLGGSKAKLGIWVGEGYRDIRDVHIDSISGEIQQRIHRVTSSGVAEMLAGAGREIEALAYPRYYLDFETIGPAVPIWKGTRPYSAIPIQWSCHIDDGPTNDSPESLRHEEFLDLSGEPPMRPLAERMIECLGDAGPILMYTTYEKTVINGLIERFPDLAERLGKIINRLVDLHPIVKAHYYHPDMLGSWSIKSVTPAMVPHMSYAELEGINEGMAASDGFLEAIDPDTSAERKAELEEQLLRYCKFDTEAMVAIVRFLAGAK
jgi:predicted RecB family nuclease